MAGRKRKKAGRREYPDELKRELVTRYLSEGHGDRIAAEAGVARGLIYRWSRDRRYSDDPNRPHSATVRKNGSAGIPTVSKAKAKPKRKAKRVPVHHGSILDRIEALENSVDDIRYVMGLDG